MAGRHTAARARLFATMLAVGLLIALFEAGGGDVPLWRLGPTAIEPAHALAGVTLRPGETLSADLPAQGHRDLMSLDIAIDAPVIVAAGRARHFAASGSEYCPRAPERIRCSFPIAHDPAGSRVDIHAAGDAPVTLTIEGWRRLRSAQETTAPGLSLPWVVGLLLLAVPAAWLLHRREVPSQWLLAGTGAALLALIQPGFTVLLLAFLVLSFKLGKAAAHGRRTAPLLMAATGLMALAAYKYGGPLVNGAFLSIGMGALVMPLGLSYFVLRLIDTQLRWRRGELKDACLREYLAFVLFPASLPAGPIESLDSFRRGRLPRITAEDVALGGARIALGLFKKVVLADYVLGTLLWKPPFGFLLQATLLPDHAAGGAVVAVLVGVLLFAYLDFSAYSDIAIGFGRLFGYRLTENFHWPILQGNLRDYWRSWHASMQQWCIRNVYFPVAMVTRDRILPLYAAMLVIGLWHAFSLSWFAYGLHHASGLALLAALEASRWGKAPKSWEFYGRPLRTGINLLYVSGGQVFAIVADFRTAATLYGKFWRALSPF